ncbi:MAG: M23 family metallopeptidase, partial [Bacteroidia bacterium]|nr:M23 family metallopeptidase [Bacteroidia bacterium]
MRKLSYLLFILSKSLFAQNNGFVFPLQEPISLVGNYGELRPNHFHAGLDFSTQGRTGLPVMAAASGYVSRIKVSAVGYGKAVYITHPNGKVTVYGHLTSYIPEIAIIVKSAQYKNESFEVELLPGKDEIKIKAGQIIGYSGNTGNSTGPHLHFEIRDEITETPINPLLYYKVPDTYKPTITHLGLYNMEDTTSPKFIKSLPINPKTGKLKKDS